jgi:hypothetical protein
MDEASALFEAKGVNGQVRLYPDRLVIARNGAMGFLTQGLKGEKAILIRQISSVQFQDATVLTRGYIHFAFVGGQGNKVGLTTAGRDENSVLFSRAQRDAFAQLRDQVMALMERQETAAATPAALPASSVADELAKLAALVDQGVLSKAEFEEQKRRLLSTL